MKNINVKNYKIGYGPMSKEIIDLLVEYSNEFNYPLMIICSRNQIDYAQGYVENTEFIKNKVKNSKNILLCRDHCGPYFKDSDKNLSLDQSIEECKKTIDCDIENNFDLIHVDVSKVNYNDQLRVAEYLIEYILNKNPKIMLEFGSEENTGCNLKESLIRVENQLKFAQKYKNIKFFVSQTGSFIKHKQLGNFDLKFNQTLTKLIHEYGFFFKEHNGDYLNLKDIELRKLSGIDAINIAPQLGTAQTKLLYKLFNNTKNWNMFYQKVLEGKKYVKWVPDNNQDQLLSVVTSGHYFFNTKEYNNLISNINFKEFLKKEIYTVFDLYKEFK